METQVFVQTVGVEVELDRRLRRGDVLIVEARRDVRDGELVVAEGDGGAVVGRYAAAQPELLVHPLQTQGGPQRVQRQSLRVRGVVIGVRSAL
ncbi:MAG TPA: S24 family peptidase [Candidatus Krumholzibacteria bacterium]|jgi:SOS-response transcriptional repressor LexA|nr:S24 family peptidase [Candidatus Krumholzibacteria bacterium]